MILCPNCQAENRSGAKFCKHCATRLPDSPAATRPLNMDTDTDPSLSNSKTVASKPATTRRLGQTLRTGTKPLRPARGFPKRPAGAIFGENYLYQALISTSENEHSYEVDMLEAGVDMQVRICPNPDCGAIFPPRSEVPEIISSGSLPKGSPMAACVRPSLRSSNVWGMNRAIVLSSQTLTCSEKGDRKSLITNAL